MRYACAHALALATALTACAAPQQSSRDALVYPCLLHTPSELSPDFAVEQHIEARISGRSASFDAVVQKRGDELVVVGLGPLGVRAFVLRQVGGEATFEQRMGPPLPFPPRNILVDIHRSFFKRLPTGDHADGVVRGKLDDEDVTETWKDGMLGERRFERASHPEGAVRILYGPGCTAARCEPTKLRVINEWFGYELLIENRLYHTLTP
jgi:hypothetical protein